MLEQFLPSKKRKYFPSLFPRLPLLLCYFYNRNPKTGAREGLHKRIWSGVQPFDWHVIYGELLMSSYVFMLPLPQSKGEEVEGAGSTSATVTSYLEDETLGQLSNEQPCSQSNASWSFWCQDGERNVSPLLPPRVQTLLFCQLFWAYWSSCLQRKTLLDDKTWDLKHLCKAMKAMPLPLGLTVSNLSASLLMKSPERKTHPDHELIQQFVA